jgi:hypothetical protein
MIIYWMVLKVSSTFRILRGFWATAIRFWHRSDRLDETYSSQFRWVSIRDRNPEKVTVLLNIFEIWGFQSLTVSLDGTDERISPPKTAFGKCAFFFIGTTIIFPPPLSLVCIWGLFSWLFMVTTVTPTATSAEFSRVRPILCFCDQCQSFLHKGFSQFPLSVDDAWVHDQSFFLFAHPFWLTLITTVTHSCLWGDHQAKWRSFYGRYFLQPYHGMAADEGDLINW